MATSAEIEDLMQGPLVAWLRSCLEDTDKLQDYEDLADGSLIHEVYLLIDPEPLYPGVTPSLRNVTQRVKNMSCIVKNIKTLYEEELGQIVVSLPDVVRLGREPESKAGLEDMRLLLLLLLGCAVQLPNKEKFIEKIKTLSIEVQHALVDCICRVTENQEIVLTQESFQESEGLLVSHIKRLAIERDRYLLLWTEQEEKRQLHLGSSSNSSTSNDDQHLAVELAEWKSKIRRQRQDLDEKSEALTELKSELDHSKIIISRLKSEMQELKQQAREVKAYRDEVDALREKAEKCNRLENDVTKYRDKLVDLQYFKDRVEQLLQDNKLLEENRELLEAQLEKARKRGDHALELQKSLMHMQQTINDLTLEQDANVIKIQQLLDENTQLTLLNKSNLLNDSSSSNNTADLSDIVSGTGDSSLSEQLTNSAHTRALELELENRQLLAEIESLQESLRCQNNEKILELEKEKKKLSLQVEALESSKKKLTQLNAEYENSIKEQKHEIRKTLESKELLLNQLQDRCKEIESLNIERHKLEDKVEELERSLEVVRQQADSITELQELEHKISNLDKTILRLREANEEKAVEVDKLTSEAETNFKEKNYLKKQLEDLNHQVSRMYEMEQETRELKTKLNVNEQTLVTLQQDLVDEKMQRQKWKNSLDKLGLAIDQLEDPDFALDRILSNPDILKVIKDRLAEDDADKDATNLNKAKLEVDIKTLQTQVTSLKSEHVALQLANSQLAAEKDEVLKDYENLKEGHERLLKDQLSLQKLHEQLSTDNDSLSEALGAAKNSINDLRTENRNLKDEIMQLKNCLQTLEAEKESLSTESKSLTNLRGEHSKLKEDFRHLFTANGKLKADFRQLQEQFLSQRSDLSKLRLSVTDLEGQLATKNDNITTLEVERTKLHNKCEFLFRNISGLEHDKHTLMDHVSKILNQYHDLLHHSLEDKEHHHLEEKIFADRVNNLTRHKEKLEEKIIQNYRQMNSVSNNKNRNGFGALVRKVKKAGSDLINKSRKSWTDEGARRGTDSDTSLEDVQSRQDGFSTLGTPGTRRTVYYSADENNSGSNEADDSVKPEGEDDPQRTSTPQHEPGLLVYNRVSAVINQSPPQSPSLSQHSSKKLSPSRDKSPLWYEYGLV